jgi:hypothetical protein
MVKLACTLLAVLVMTAASPLAQEEGINVHTRSQVDQEHTNWIDDVLQSISSIKPGRRERTFFVFSPERGLSSRTQRKYIYKQCPYIKVDVVFSVVDDVGADQEATTENPEDTIVKISWPYLEYSIAD